MATPGGALTRSRPRYGIAATGDRCRPVSVALTPELVHPGECLWPLVLEDIPGFQICHRPIAGMSFSVIMQRTCMHFDPEEHEFLAVEKFLDPRNGEPVFLNVEQ